MIRDNLRLVLSVGGLLLVLGIVFRAGAADALQTQSLVLTDDNDGRAGTCYSFYPDTSTGHGRPYLPLAYAAGSRWDRFDFVWPNLQQSDGSLRSEGLDAYDTLVNDLDSSGFKIVGILLWTPDWAASSGVAGQGGSETQDRPLGWYAPIARTERARPSAWFTSAASSPPRGLYEEWYDWEESDGDPINYWGRFVYHVVARYGDRVKHWEMWNEPEWTYFWTGTSSEYAQLLKVGYQATKAACPTCQVLFGGLHYWANPDYYKWVMNTLRRDPAAADHDYFFDILSVHLYSRSSNTYDVVNTIRSEMTARISDHPIWLTETGVPIWDDSVVDPVINKYDYAATQTEAASYVIQSYANALAAGVSRYFFFRTHDADMWEYFGLVRNDRTLRPAYSAMQVATSYLFSPTMVTRQIEAGDIQRVTLWGTPRGKVSVLWNRTPVPVDFDFGATLSEALLVDQLGAIQSIEAVAGTYSIALPGATANLASDPSDYFISGAPFVVIEEDTVPPSIATVDPLPATTYSDTIRVSWSATDDQAGVWGGEVQVRQGETGEWAPWLSLAETAGSWWADYDLGQHDTVYCFRARVWDRAGNLGAWSINARCTRLHTDRDLHLSLVAVFGDEDGDSVWDAGSGEVALQNITFRLLDTLGTDVVPPGFSQSWEITTTLRAGEYTLLIEPDDWSSPPPGWLPRRLKLDLPPGETMWELEYLSIGLLRHRASSYLPLVTSDDR